MRTAQRSPKGIRHERYPRQASSTGAAWAATRCDPTPSDDRACASMSLASCEDYCRLGGISAGTDRVGTRSRRSRLQVIRRQIKEGVYDVDARLAAVLDRVFEDLESEDGNGRTASR